MDSLLNVLTPLFIFRRFFRKQAPLHTAHAADEEIHLHRKNAHTAVSAFGCAATTPNKYYPSLVPLPKFPSSTRQNLIRATLSREKKTWTERVTARHHSCLQPPLHPHHLPAHPFQFQPYCHSNDRTESPMSLFPFYISVSPPPHTHLHQPHHFSFLHSSSVDR